MPRAKPNKVLLTDAVIENLQPRKDRAFLTWDSKQFGLAIQTQPSGNKSWKVVYSRFGRSRWYSLGRCDAVNLTAARKLAGKIMVKVADGADPQAERKAHRISGTFGELADLYREYAEKKKERNKSWRQQDALVTKYLLPRWKELKAADIKRGDVKSLVGKIAAPILANQVLAAASAVFSWAISEDLVTIAANPAVGIKRNKTTKRERILSDSELPNFWAAFGKVGFLEGMALKFLLLTGQRPGEVAHLRTEHVDGNWWTLPGKPIPELDWPGTKNAGSHRVWLPEAARKILKEMDTTGLVFAGSRGAAVATLDKAMRDICKRLEVERATPHDLRRTHGSTITRLGFGRDALNRIQNHREGGIADVYDQHEYADENRKIMEAVADKIMSIIDGGGADNVVRPTGLGHLISMS